VGKPVQQHRPVCGKKNVSLFLCTLLPQKADVVSYDIDPRHRGDERASRALALTYLHFHHILKPLNLCSTDRVDPQNRGGEYRSLIGLPGGTAHPVYPAVEATAAKAGFRLQAGTGNDPDTLGKKLVYVYDTAAFPFYQAEVYHQYHNDFQSPAYGKAYNELADLAFQEGRIKTTGCPDKV
jgi:hypothetical protein